MKQFKFWLFSALLTISGSTMFVSCTQEDNPISAPEQPLVLTGQAAVEWTKAHLDSLVAVYLADCGNLLDPDNTRDLLKKIGYTRLNVMDYRASSHIIDSVVFYRLMDRAIEANNKTIVFTMGMYGCGKTARWHKAPKRVLSQSSSMYITMPRRAIPTAWSVLSGGKRVTHEEAKKWDYTMTDDLKQKLRDIEQSYINSGKLNAEQIKALQQK